MIKRSTLAVLAVLVTTPTIAPAQQGDFMRRQSFTLPVALIDADSFEVIEADGAGGSQLWCAAGLYVRKVLGQRGGDIYVETPRGPAQSMAGRKGVVFTTAPTQTAIPSFTLGVRRAGLTHSMSLSYALCSDLPQLRLRLSDGTLVRR